MASNCVRFSAFYLLPNGFQLSFFFTCVNSDDFNTIQQTDGRPSGRKTKCLGGVKIEKMAYIDTVMQHDNKDKAQNNSQKPQMSIMM